MAQSAPERGQKMKTDIMNKKQGLMATLAGVALLGTMQAQAQISYNSGDLLLNFRNTLNSGSTGPDVVVDLGSAATFATLTGVTDLDPASGAGAKFSQTDLATAFGSGLANVGFSVGATTKGVSSPTSYYVSTYEATATTYNSSSSFPEGSGAASSSDQTKFSTAINGVGNGAKGLNGTSFLSSLGSHSSSQAVLESTSGFNYGGQATSGSQPTVISYNTAIPTTVALESSQYAALFNVPQLGSGSATELGYFTFNDVTGDITYTSNLSAVPEPATYGLMAGVGLLALAFRRQIVSLAV
jgi:hypothetical protein